MKPEDVEKIRKGIIERLKKSGYKFEAFDDIDYITVAADIPYSYQYGISANGGNYTVDDAIGRLDTDMRYAFVGRLMYGAGPATYQAMCALFLKPKKTLFFSRYANSGIWRTYWPDRVAEPLKAKTVFHPAATLEAWQELMRTGNKNNLVYINSSGGSMSWSTSRGGGKPDDIPFSEPCSVHMTHSGSFGSPFNVGSIAVRWIRGGAYCYHGSHSEPYLDAFVPPNESLKEALKGLPLSEVFRWSHTKRWRPWKLAFVGDPMFTISGKELERIAILPIVKMPKEVDKMNEWMLVRLLSRLSFRINNYKMTDLVKILKTLAALKFPKKKEILFVKFLTAIPDNEKIQKRSRKNREQLQKIILTSLDNKSPLYDKVKKAFQK